MHGTMHNTKIITQETLDKIISKMCKAQSDFGELNHAHDAIKVDCVIIRRGTERTTNQSNDMN